MKEQTFTVTVSISDLKESFSKILNSPHKALIAQVVIDNLINTSKGLKQLYMALNGIRETVPFKVDDKVLVRTDYLSSYKIDVKRLVEGVDLYQGKLICRVEEINLVKADSVRIVYVGYPNITATEKEEIEQWVDPEFYKMELFNDNFPIE